MNPRISPPPSLVLAYWMPIAVALALLAVLYSTDLDGQLTDPFFDAASGTFPLRDHWLVGTILHTFGKYLTIAIGAGLLYVGLAGRRVEKLRPWRRAAFYWFACMALTTGVIGLIKSVSPIPVPWNAVRFGGPTPHYLPFFWPAGAPHSSGWPCAHAAGAFAMTGTYFVLRDSMPRFAWVGFAAALSLGTLFAGAQVLRGAHFPSHGIWSFMIAWTICTILYRVMLRPTASETPRPDDSTGIRTT